ncbi:MAG: methylcrotonoyl-CoA carboxylase, partial [Rhizobiaceae bacterium]
MARLNSSISPNSETFRANRKANLESLEKVREAAAAAAAGGGEAARERHVSRGKLLPRD